LSPAARARSLERTLAARPPGEPLWVFAYGSLLWRPAFEPLGRLRAVAPGHRRGFCVWTVEARGTPERPGLGLGLVPAASGAGCAGAALGLGRAGRERALAALWEREMLTGVYQPRWVRLLAEGEPLAALAFVVDPAHPQYAGDLGLAASARLVAAASGRLGACRDYLLATVRALAELGIDDPDLAALAAEVGAERADR
jgi:cation transport protein ChaC